MTHTPGRSASAHAQAETGRSADSFGEGEDENLQRGNMGKAVSEALL